MIFFSKNRLHIFYILCITLIIWVFISKQNDDIWKHYRLSDMYNGYIYHNQIDEYYSYPIKYPNSIATKYIKHAHKFNDIHLLNRIVPVINDSLVNIHIRLGDVLKGKRNDTYSFERLSRKYKSLGTYGVQINAYEKLLLNELRHISNIHIYCNYHKDPRIIQIDYDLNEEYIMELLKLMQSYNKSYILHKNENPDEDFIKMCNSKIFISSFGGYSRLISDIVKLRNNKVIHFSNHENKICFV